MGAAVAAGFGSGAQLLADVAAAVAVERLDVAGADDAGARWRDDAAPWRH